VRDRYPSSSCPLRLGDFPSFYRPRREQFTGVTYYSPMCGGVASSATELTTVLANLAPVGACVLQGWFEGAVNGDPYEAQWQA
jgi:hypothetical protein